MKTTEIITHIAIAVSTGLLVTGGLIYATHADMATQLAESSASLQIVYDRALAHTTAAELAAEFGGDASEDFLDPAIKAAYNLFPLAKGNLPARDVPEFATADAWIFHPTNPTELRAAIALKVACATYGERAKVADTRFLHKGDGTPWVLDRHCEQAFTASQPGEFVKWGASSAINPESEEARALLAGLERLSLLED